jgi:hypothetical protein
VEEDVDRGKACITTPLHLEGLSFFSRGEPVYAKTITVIGIQ